MFIGIDLGTSNSSLAVFDGDSVVIVPNSLSENLTPSVVRMDARGAASRRDWAAVLRITRIGQGRSVRFLELLALAESGMTFSPNRLWLAWSLAPLRIRSYRRVRVLARKPQKRAKVTPPPPELRPAQASSEASVVPDARLRRVRMWGRGSRTRKPHMKRLGTPQRRWRRAASMRGDCTLHAPGHALN